MIRLVVQELNEEPEESLLQPPSEENNVQLHLRPSNATLNHAQLTASCPSGENGANVTNHAVVELPQEPDTFKLPHYTAARNAEKQ